jgi:hypothetical protein
MSAPDRPFRPRQRKPQLKAKPALEWYGSMERTGETVWVPGGYRASLWKLGGAA